MKSSCICHRLRPLLAMIVLSTFAFGASKEKTLYAFQGGSDGANPYASLIADAQGNLYGTTQVGGGACSFPGFTNGCGTVFELIAPSSPSGTWQEVALYSFHGTDGALPLAALTFDKAGNLYGTTELGGVLNSGYCGNPNGSCGVVFELSPPNPPGGPWTESVLHAFEGDTDGAWPASPVLFDSEGNLYGTTEIGGPGDGTAYELSPSSSGWTETVIYAFSGLSDGGEPEGSIVLDSAGNLYGTTRGADPNIPATAFELSPALPGQPWTETTIADIAYWGNGLVRGRDGNLYGSATGGGSSLPGTLFQLSSSGGSWTQTVIFTFAQRNGTSLPEAITLDANLNIYLMDYAPQCGEAIKFTAMPGNTWKSSELYEFTSLTRGCFPEAALTSGKWGLLYGTMSAGGPNNLDGGVVFAVAP